MIFRVLLGGVLAMGISSAVNAASCAVPGQMASMTATAGSMMNGARGRNGRGALGNDRSLQAAAQAHACDMVAKGYFSHRSPNGARAKERARKHGCRSRLVAENIAGGQATAEQVMREWLASPSHRANIMLGRGIDRFGLGAVRYGNGYMWVMVFSKGC